MPKAEYLTLVGKTADEVRPIAKVIETDPPSTEIKSKLMNTPSTNSEQSSSNTQHNMVRKPQTLKAAQALFGDVDDTTGNDVDSPTQIPPEVVNSVDSLFAKEATKTPATGNRRRTSRRPAVPDVPVKIRAVAESGDSP